MHRSPPTRGLTFKPSVLNTASIELPPQKVPLASVPLSLSFNVTAAVFHCPGRGLSTCLRGLAPPQPGLGQNSRSLFLRGVWNVARTGLRNGIALSLMSAVIAWISISDNRGSPLAREGRTSDFRRSFLSCCSLCAWLFTLQSLSSERWRMHLDTALKY